MDRSDITIVFWIVKALIWSAIVATLATEARKAGVGQAAMTIVLTAIAMEITNARFIPSAAATVVKCGAFVLLATIDKSFALLTASAAFDLAFRAPVGFATIPVIAAAVSASPELRVTLALVAVIAGLFGWIARRYGESWRSHTASLDRERRSRYRLEEARRRLEATSRELVRAAEHAERNRIAHAIHDDVGHRLTGILMQLQAARRLSQSRPQQSEKMLDTAILTLTEAVESVRETVYDLRPRAASDSAALRRICAEFRFCPVDLSLDDEAYSGLGEAYREACLMTIRELLTNAARHSRASLLRIRIDTGDYLKLFYEDDGIGSHITREGLGISGIRSRIEGLNGSLAVSGHAGFVVRIAIPLEGRDE